MRDLTLRLTPVRFRAFLMFISRGAALAADGPCQRAATASTSIGRSAIGTDLT